VTPGQVLARLADLADPCAIVVRFEDDPFASVIVTRLGDHVAAFRNKCPHAGYPLHRADGRIVVQEGGYLVCAAHGASFTLNDGACAGGPCNGDGLVRIGVVVRGGSVVVT
jgi:nitrite reductase/ring-hydroxylating ferredoxin subunit